MLIEWRGVRIKGAQDCVVTELYITKEKSFSVIEFQLIVRCLCNGINSVAFDTIPYLCIICS